MSKEQANLQRRNAGTVILNLKKNSHPWDIKTSSFVLNECHVTYYESKAKVTDFSK